MPFARLRRHVGSRRSSFRSIASAARLALIVGSLALLSRPALALDDIRLLSFGGATNLPIWIAQERGFFAGQGVRVLFSTTNGSVEQIRDLYAGKADIISTAFDNIIAYTEGQSDVALPGPADIFGFVGIGGGMNTLMARPEIASFADIKGKTVAVDALKSGYGLVLYQILQDRGGLTLDKDYNAVSVGDTNHRLDAMRSGKAVAAIVGAPQDIDAAKDGLKALADAAVELPDYQGSALVTRRGWAKEHDAALLGLIRALVAAQDYIFANKADATAVLRANIKGLSEADAGRLYDRLVSPGGLSPHAALSVAGVETLLRMRGVYGEPKRTMGPTTRYIDTSFYTRATAGK